MKSCEFVFFSGFWATINVPHIVFQLSLHIFLLIIDPWTFNCFINLVQRALDLVSRCIFLFNFMKLDDLLYIYEIKCVFFFNPWKTIFQHEDTNIFLVTTFWQKNTQNGSFCLFFLIFCKLAPIHFNLLLSLSSTLLFFFLSFFLFFPSVNSEILKMRDWYIDWNTNYINLHFVLKKFEKLCVV